MKSIGKRSRKKIIRCLLALMLALMLLASAFAAVALPLIKKADAQPVGSSAEGLAVLEVTSGRVLYEKNAHRKKPMASTTKILTAITVIDNTEDLDKIHGIPASCVGVEGSSIYLEKDEKLSIRDLLYGLMLQSGNDCAEALAVLTAGSKQQFADLMNKKAKEIGAENSHFTNPHGLHDPEHYTTAYDLALISCYALKNPTFKEIVATKRYTCNYGDREYKRVILNKNKLLSTYEGCDGVKTGFTKKAGRCYVSSATRNGMQVVAAVLNCGPMFEECASFMTKAFDEYKMCEVLKPFEELGAASVTDGKVESVPLCAGESKYYPLKNSELGKIRYETESTKKIRPPQKEGTQAGKIKVMLENELLFEENLFIMKDVVSKNVGDRLKELIESWT